MELDVLKRMFAEKLQDSQLLIKVSSMMQFIIDNALEDFKDIENKFKDPANASEDVISSIINEYGFSYINDLAQTITGIDKSLLIQFLSLVSLLKGHKDGLNLVLSVLGLNSEITEWWEEAPQGELDTFRVTIFMNLSQVVDVFDTLAKFRIFVKNYVYPQLLDTQIIFDIEFVEIQTAVAAFNDQTFEGAVLDEVL